MATWAIAWRNLRTRPLQTALTTLIIALGVGLAVAVVVLAAGLRRGLTEAGGPFEIVVGPKGSATQLVVSSVLLQDIPLGNLQYTQYERLASDRRVATAIPIALGDNAAGLRIVGTTPQLFQVALAPGDPPFYQVARGQPFRADFEAVLGSEAAAQLGLDLGGELVSAHGVLGDAGEAGHKSFPYRVVGILARSGTPADRGVYVSLESYWHVHGASQSERAPTAAGQVKDAHDPGVTAVLLRGRTISASYQLYQELNASSELQAALPGAVLTQFLDLLGQGQRVLTFVTYIALAMAALSTALSLYSAVLARQRDLAVLRALGASRLVIVGVALWESLLQGLLGSLLGALLGYAAAALVGALVVQRSALAVPLRAEPAALLILAAMLLLGLIAGLLPTLRAYRIEPARVLAGPA